MNDTTRCTQCGAQVPSDAPSGLCPKCLLQAGFESAQASGAAAAGTVPSPESSGFRPPAPEELAERFPQFEIIELLGKGGMGAVYKARQPSLDRLVAIKILPPEVGKDPSFAERFAREARALARLTHPNIVAVHDFGQSGDLFWFAMEYVEGVDLRQTIRAGQILPEQALAIVPQICDALQYAHDEGIVHRDIKPENILVDKRGRVKIADFGLSKLLGEDKLDVTLTGTHQVMGTLRYMAPEQMQGTHSVDHRADIYSLGVVFYELLTGELPIGRFEPPSKKVQIDVRLDEVVLRALEQKPEQRYQHASEVKTDVEAIRMRGVPSAAPPSELEPKVLEKYRTEGKIQAIRLYREETRVGLREAKNAVEAIARKHGIVEPPLPLGKKLAVMAIAMALVLTGMIGVFVLDLSPIITTTLWWGFIILVFLFNIPNLVRAYRLRGTPEYRQGWLLGGLVLMVFLGFPLVILVLDFLANPEPLLTYLYRELDVKPGRHDVAFIHGIFMTLVLGTLAWLIWFLVRIRSRRRETEKASAERPPLVADGIGLRTSRSSTRTPAEQVKGPAIGLIATGVADWIGIPAAVGVLWLASGQPTPPPMAAGLGLASLVVSAVILLAGFKMMHLEARPLAILGSVLAMIVTPGNVIGLPLGVWALAVLTRREVKAAFAARPGT